MRRATVVPRLFAFPTLLLSLLATPSPAQTWRLTTADFRSEGILLHGIDAAGLHVSPMAGGEERLVPYEQFLELTRSGSSSQPAGKFVLHLIGGDRLGGEPVGIKGN